MRKQQNGQVVWGTEEKRVFENAKEKFCFENTEAIACVNNQNTEEVESMVIEYLKQSPIWYNVVRHYTRPNGHQHTMCEAHGIISTRPCRQTGRNGLWIFV